MNDPVVGGSIFESNLSVSIGHYSAPTRQKNSPETSFDIDGLIFILD